VNVLKNENIESAVNTKIDLVIRKERIFQRTPYEEKTHMADMNVPPHRPSNDH
jgi:hypothetical protein